MFQYQKVNDYILLKFLRKERFGEVHLAESANKKQYALKIIPVTNQNKEHAKKQARMYISFDHPNILNAQEVFFFEHEKYLVIVLEYCPGGNLHSLIGKIDHNKCKEFMIQVAEGLNYLHEEKKTLHRDIKPENIVMSNGAPKIADFGIAKIMKPEGLSSKSCTIQYAAPEFLNEEKYGFPADIWSLGTVFLELLLGKRIKDLVKGELPPGFRNKFPFEDLLDQIKEENLRELVRKMLNQNSEQRLTSRQVLEWLKGKKFGVQDNNIKNHQKRQFIFEKVKVNKNNDRIQNQRMDKTSAFIKEDVKGNKKNGWLQNERMHTKNQNNKEDVKGKQLKSELKNELIDYRKELNITHQNQFFRLLRYNNLFPNLTHFKFDACSLTDDFLYTLSQIPSIQQIFPKLWYFNLGNNHITNQGLKALTEVAGQLTNLQWIDLDNNKITDLGLKVLTDAAYQLNNLQRIGLSNNQITDEGIKVLADAAGQLNHLQSINLDNNQITDVGLKVLVGVGSKLKNLQWISLNNNQITDTGIKILVGAAGKLKNLQWISLNNNQITDKGLRILASAPRQLKNLRGIWLQHTKVTMKTVSLVKTICKIKFEIYIDLN